MKEVIRDRAFRLGFDDCRFAAAEKAPHASAFQQWLEDGHHAGMAWLARDPSKRTDPRQILPGARTVVCLAASYGRMGRCGAPGPDTQFSGGFIARYARHRDYHLVLEKPLQALADFIREQGGADIRCVFQTDAGPLMERDFAQQAGLGFAGRHTNLIHRRLGNWFFLAVIVTTLELEPDGPEKNHCGSCRRCLDACPTGALVRPFILDARRCLSWLTIESKGAIPEALRPAVGGRIFGCDDCLAACPWNRFAQEGRLMREHFRLELQQPDLVRLAGMDQDAFRQHFGGTPLERLKHPRFLMNLCVALGNTGGEKALPVLGKLAGENDPLVSEHAAWAVRQIRRRSGQAVSSTTGCVPL